MRAPTLTLAVLSLVLCASARNGFGFGQFSSLFAGSDGLAPAGLAQKFSSPPVGSDRRSPPGPAQQVSSPMARSDRPAPASQAQQFSSPFVGSQFLASLGQARQFAKQIEDRVMAMRSAQGFGGGGAFSSGLGSLRSISRGSRGLAERALRERGSGTNSVRTLLDKVDVAIRPIVLWTQGSWTETFASVRSSRWWFAGPWANGGIFGNGFEPAFYTNDYGKITLPIAKKDFVNPDWAGSGVPGQTYDFTGSEIRSQTVDYGYGCYSWCVRPTRTSGVVSSLYVYSAGIWDTPWKDVSVPHREIDIEFLVCNGKVKMQSNMFNDPDWSSGNQKTFEELHDIPSAEFHTYSFKWESNAITWYIDGVAVRTIDNSIDPIPQQKQQTMRLMMNSYSVDQGNPDAVRWAGAIPSDFTDDASIIKWFKFSKGSSCTPQQSCNAVA